MRTAIIGGAGGMGKLLVNHFLELDYSVIVSDPRPMDEITSVEVTSNNTDAVANADLVILSVPLEDASEIIHEVAPHMSKNSILCEITSLKSTMVEELRKASKYVRPLSIHPLFGPGATALKKKYALIPIVDVRDEKQLAEMLFPGSQIIVVEAEVHDRIMALTLSLPYFTNMILASVLKDEDILLLEQLSGTTFSVQFMLTSSIMSHSSEFHTALHSENSYSMEILQKLLSRTKEEISHLMKDIDEFKRSFREIKSALEEKLDLKEKYHQMYRVLKEMEKEVGQNS